jgi:hypothetical protein
VRLRGAGHVAPPATPPRFACLYRFLTRFQGSFCRTSSAQNGSYVVPLEILGSLLSKYINFARIGARKEKLWLLEVGGSELFFCIFPARILAKLETLPANQELHVIARVTVFLKVPNLWINSQQVGRNLRMKAAVREEKRVKFSAGFPYFRQFLGIRLT